MLNRAFPIAAVFAAGAVAFGIRTAVAAPASSLTVGTSVAPGRALDDATIVAIFDGANTADVETGGLAEKKGSTKEIREFGAMLARDHKNVRQQGRDLAKKLGVTPTAPKPDTYAAQHAEAMKKLQGLEGKAFDRAFLEHEIAYHDAVITAVTNTLMPAIQNAELKDLVAKVAPAFVAHREAAKNMLTKTAM
jgi:putative membrane protein